MLTGALIGFAVAVAMIVMNKSQAKAGTGLPGEIAQAMRGKGPMTLKQIAALVGKDSLMGRGKVAQAIHGLHSAGKLVMTPAPPGTPQLQKVDHITYEVV